MNYEPKCGDVFLCDSDKTGPKIVKFLQQSPTIWQQIWRYFRHTLEPVNYYHAGMVVSETEIIEQQWKVQRANVSKIMNWDVVVYRFKNQSITSELYRRAEEDLGKTYDIPQLIGKTLTWITGIKGFVRLLGALSKENEICVTRIGDWLEGYCDFGVKTKHEITTKILDEYFQSHPEEWELVYKNIKI